MPPLNLLVADDASIIRLDLKEILQRMGHRVVAEAGDGQRALELARELRPDLVILDIKMPLMDGIDAARLISQERIAPVLLLTAYSQQDLVQRAVDAGVFAYVVKPFTEADLFPAIELAIARFNEFDAIRQEAADLKEALETRKAVERARGILMSQYQLSEQEAFQRIQRQSMNHRRSMRQIAEAIIIAHEVGGEPPPRK
jgi:AmiR/NasT family two-component response regulator